MQKSISLSLAVCLVLTGCQVFKKSETWDKVTRTRIDTRGASDASAAYAEGLSRELKASRVEHKIVNYQYRYKTPAREEAVGHGTAVIYRDDTNAANPWWLKDERSGRPVWLPTTEVNKQIAFYIRRNADVIETQDAKQMVAMEKPSAITRITKISRPEPRVPQPARLIARVPAPAPAPVVDDSETLFRALHGTTYDAASPLDREKMNAMRETRVRPRTAAVAYRSF